ncbi:MAG: Holliday junction resolvase RecU [Bacilli bacterium]
MKYPNGSNKVYNNKISTSNRGMTLESQLNQTNTYYLNNDIAVIYKKPTPITVNEVSYHSKKDVVITKAHYIVPSTTDYNGLYKGSYVDFEAKETRKEYFPLANIHQHQINHLEKIINNGGLSFIIVRFVIINETYLLPTNKLIKFINNNTRKSIPIAYFKQEGFLIKDGYLPNLDYLKIVDILKERKNEKIN